MKNIIVSIILFFLGFLVVFLVSNRNTAPSQDFESLITSTPPPTQKDMNGLVPGVSTLNDLSLVLGKPMKTEDNTLFFPSGKEGKENEITIYNNSVVFIKEKNSLLDQKTFMYYASGISSLPLVLYGPNYIAGVNLYVYLNEGLALLGNKENNFVYEAWYFRPTSYEDLKSFPAFSGYRASPPREPDR